LAERRNLVCSFDPSIPRITPYVIREWTFASLRVPEHKVTMIQIDDIMRVVYIKRLMVIVCLPSFETQVDRLNINTLVESCRWLVSPWLVWAKSVRV
jgi:hypothetical protein